MFQRLSLPSSSGLKEAEAVSETLDYAILTWLIDREDFTAFCYHESFKCFIKGIIQNREISE
jgi:hypothetical protein